MLSLFRFILLSVGLVLIISGSFVLYKRNEPNRLYFENVDQENSSLAENEREVSGIIIEDISVRLPVVKAKKDGNVWETTSSGVSYLVSSPLPGETGNSIMYGHNWGSILGRLNRVKKGSRVEIHYSDGTKNIFKVADVTEVSPRDSSLLENTNDKRLTIYTCSGLLDQKRLVVTAFLI